MQCTVCFISQARGRKNVYSPWFISHICYTHMFTVLHHTLSPRGPSPLLGERQPREKREYGRDSEWIRGVWSEASVGTAPRPSWTSSVWALGGWKDRRFWGLEEEEQPAGALTEWYCELTDWLTPQRSRDAGCRGGLFLGPTGPLCAGALLEVGQTDTRAMAECTLSRDPRQRGI